MREQKLKNIFVYANVASKLFHYGGKDIEEVVFLESIPAKILAEVDITAVPLAHRFALIVIESVKAKYADVEIPRYLIAKSGSRKRQSLFEVYSFKQKRVVKLPRFEAKLGESYCGKVKPLVPSALAMSHEHNVVHYYLIGYGRYRIRMQEYTTYIRNSTKEYEAMLYLYPNKYQVQYIKSPWL